MKTFKNILLARRRALAIAGGLGSAAIAGLIGQPLSASPVLAEIVVNIEAGPPPPPREVIVASPGPGYVWVGGFWDGQPGHYRWTRGHWDRPPHGRTHWTAPRWTKDAKGHYHKSEGGWR